MLGLPPAEEEIAAVEADPTALRGLVDAWFVRPEAQAKLGTFFSKAFQQTQIGPADFFDQITVDSLPDLPLFTQLQESMSRTALKTIANGQPFTDTVTTHTIMMTPTMMSLYLALDQLQVDDAGKVVPQPAHARRLAQHDAGRSGSPTGRPSIRTRRRWWRTRSRSPRRWTRAARTSCTSPCRPRSPAACRSWMTPGTSSSTTRAPR